MYGDKVVTKKQEKDRKEKRRRAIKRTVLILLAFAVVVTVALTAYFISKPFKISALRFVSEDPRFEADARPIVEEYLGKNAFEIAMKSGGLTGIKDFFSGKMRSIEKELSFLLPQYKNITVKFEKNRILKVSGEPRGSYVLLYEDGEVIVTDRAGTVVVVCERDNLAEMTGNLTDVQVDGPVVSGLDITEYSPGTKVAYSADVQWKYVMGIYYAILSDDALAANVTYIYLPSIKNAYFYCKNSVVVKVGSTADDEALYSKLERLSAIFRSGNELIHNGTITLSDVASDVFKPDAENPNPDPTPTPVEVTAAPPDTSPTPTPTAAPSETPTVTTPTPTTAPIATPTGAPSVTPTPTPAVTPTPTPTSVPTPTPTPDEGGESPTPTPTPTPDEGGESPTPTPTPTPTPDEGGESPTPTPTPTPTP
ncbi:MAG: hypothetical protein J5921_02295, partial [Clostridia bacterium]|nr:hypothetical protein [Clostridia bacterium]